MRQFDVFENPAPKARHYAPYVVVLSSHHLEHMDDVIVAPLVNDAKRPVSGLEVTLDLFEQTLVLVVMEMATLRARDLRNRVGSVLEIEFEIRRALDRLFTGF